LYWQALHLWERATGRGYESALPGGASDARNEAAVRELVSDLFRIWDDLSERRALPEELYVVELGVGNGNQAKAWLDEFRVMDQAHGRDYYRRLHYLMCDYSPHVLDIARKTVAGHGEHVSSLVLDATTPTTVLGFLRYKVFLVYVSNVYDNLPCDEVVNIGGRAYCVETRAFLPEAEAAEIAATASTATTDLPALIHKLLQIGPELVAAPRGAVRPDAGP
jgi:SAM-dependent MidA family methyltransferase